MIMQAASRSAGSPKPISRRAAEPRRTRPRKLGLRDIDRTNAGKRAP